MNRAQLAQKMYAKHPELAKKIAPKKGLHKCKIGQKSSIELDLGDWFERKALWSECERGIIDSLKLDLKKGDVFFDIGAHVGIISVSIAEHIGDRGTVYAFEPDMRAYTRLYENMLLNPNLRIIPVGYPLAEAPKDIHMYESSVLGWSTTVKDATGFGISREAKFTARPITATSIDKLIYGIPHPFKPPQAIKIDTEGSEFDILRGAQKLLKDNPPKLIIAEQNNWINGFCGRTAKHFLDMDEYMKEFGYYVNNFSLLDDCGVNVIYYRKD